MHIIVTFKHFKNCCSTDRAAARHMCYVIISTLRIAMSKKAISRCEDHSLLFLYYMKNWGSENISPPPNCENLGRSPPLPPGCHAYGASFRNSKDKVKPQNCEYFETKQMKTG